MTLASVYRGQYGDFESWTSVKDTIWTLPPLYVAYVVWKNLMNGTPHCFCHSSTEPINEQRRQQPQKKQVQAETESVESGTQTDGRNFLLDAMRLHRNHKREMRRLTRQTQYLRRHMQAKLKESGDRIRTKAKHLSSEQLELLPLVSRKKALLAEQATLEELLREEQCRQQDLLERFYRLNRGIQSLQTEISCNNNASITLFELANQNLGNGDGPQMSRKGQVTCDQPVRSLDRGDSSVTGIPKVRMLYALEAEDNGDMKYIQVKPELYPMYESGSRSLPRKVIPVQGRISERNVAGRWSLSYRR